MLMTKNLKRNYQNTMHFGGQLLYSGNFLKCVGRKRFQLISKDIQPYFNAGYCSVCVISECVKYK